MAILNNSNAISSGGYDINNSLRFRSSASAYISRTPASAGNRRTWTLSLWVKRGLYNSAAHTLFRTPNSDPSTGIRFTGTGAVDSVNDAIRVFFNNAASGDLQTTQVFRDSSAWYHIVLAVDTTQATASNRVKLYINGNQVTAFATATYPTQNYVTDVNATALHVIGGWNSQEWLDGYLTEYNFIDGSQLTPSSFGETDATTGVWKPKAYTGTYGTNGFYLKFSDIATTSGSNAGLGKDFSGNANYFTTNNISVTAGTTYDAMIDSPTLTSATVANYATWNPLTAGGLVTFSEANLKALSTSASAPYNIETTMKTPTSGKWYAEVTMAVGASSPAVGIGNNPATSASNTDQFTAYRTNATYITSGMGASSSGTPATFTTNDVIGIAYDADAGTLVFYKNNTLQSGGFTGITAGNYSFIVRKDSASGDGGFLNCGQRPFSYTPPTGFVRLNTFNLPDSTIKKGSSYMDATLYTGTGATLSITNAGAFKPDFVWIKDRTTAYPNMLFDSVRGASKRLISNTTDAEATETDTQTSFNSNGFSVSTNLVVNRTSDAFVGWQWQAGQGSTSSNTSGTITSTVSVNATAGFSIVSYTGNSVNGATVGHGLGVTPAMIIIKERSAVNDWLIWHQSNGTQIMFFTTAAKSTNAGAFNNTLPTSSVITLGTWDISNGSPNTYVAYCWAEIAGFSKFGSFTGNSSTDGPFIYCGFRPKWILFKNTANYDWHIFDASRSPYNLTQAFLKPNLSNAEASNTDVSVDLLSNGFKLRGTDLAINGPSANIIYAAYAENPFKNANAR